MYTIQMKSKKEFLIFKNGVYVTNRFSWHKAVEYVEAQTTGNITIGREHLNQS